MTKTPDPPETPADVFAQYKAHYEGERRLKPAMRRMAAQELKAGRTVGELAKLTGLTPEVFRRMARDLGIERLRPPTVGKLKADPAPAPPEAIQPGKRPPLPATPDGPPSDLGLSSEVAALSAGQVRALAGQAEARHPDWGKEVRRELAGTDPQWIRYAIVEAAFRAGYVDLCSDSEASAGGRDS